MEITYDYKSKIFIAQNVFDSDDIELLKSKRFFFNPIKDRYETSKIRSAARLREYFDDKAKDLLRSVSVNITPWPGRPVYSPIKILDQYQKDGVKFAMERNHSYIAFEQGLGKTPLAVSFICTQLDMTQNNSPRKVVLVVPPFLVSNWIREIKEWDDWDEVSLNVIALRESKDAENIGHSHILIVPDSLIAKESVRKYFSSEQFRPGKYHVVVDEAHRFNDAESQRTKALYEDIIPQAMKVVLMSGTPMVRPINLWPALSNLAHDCISYMSKEQYGKKFCGGETVEFYNKDGLQKRPDYRGSSNEDELNKRLQKFMTVEKFADHFKMDYKERVVMVDTNVPKEILDIEYSILKNHKISDLVGSSNLGALATYRKKLASTKIKVCAEYIDNALESHDRSVLCFGIHQELLLSVFEKLKDKWNAKIIMGGVGNKERDEIEREYQLGRFRLLFGQTMTMVGLNFTKGSHGIFLESAWTHRDNDQAKRRLMRRGQMRGMLFDHLVLANSLEEKIVRNTLDEKRRVSKIIKRRKVL